MRDTNCLECTRLWTEYEKATREFFRLDGKVRVAALVKDRGDIDRMRRLLDQVDHERKQLRSTIAEHETQVHSANAEESTQSREAHKTRRRV